MKNPSWIYILAIALAALSRLLPHPPNFSPVIAIALFGGAVLADRRLALVVPLSAMLLADLVLGFHRTLPFVYMGMAAVVAVGYWLGARRQPRHLLAAGLGGSVSFFIISNLGVWLSQGMYSLDPAGLIACFSAAVPFFHNTLLATLFYGACLFLLEWLTQRRQAAASASAV